MRNRNANDGLTLNANAGSYVVVLGLNISDALRSGLRGFAISRTNHTENASYWISGTKVFESVEPHPASGPPVLKPVSAVPDLSMGRL
jgi:hypothetical protein